MTASDPLLRQAYVMLERAGKEHKAPIWQRASEMLSSDTRNRVAVNLGRISRLATSGQALFVPGKVLGDGILDKKVVVGAYAFSSSARSKIEAEGGSALNVEQFLKKFPKGSGVRLVK